MICSRCGLEYPDDMTECPGCHAPNENIEAQVLTDSERDSFTGVTIDAGDGDPDRFTIQDDEPGKTGKQSAWPEDGQKEERKEGQMLYRKPLPS